MESIDERHLIDMGYIGSQFTLIKVCSLSIYIEIYIVIIRAQTNACWSKWQGA